jgi:hypothetical protein
MPNFFVDKTTDLWQTVQYARPFKGDMTILRTFHQYPNVWRMQNPVPVNADVTGTGIEWFLVIDDTGNAKHVAATDPKKRSTTDVTAKFFARWGMSYSNYLVTDTEIKLCSSEKTRYYRLQDMKREIAKGSMYNMLERDAVRLPALTGDEKDKDIYGLSYSIPPITGAQVTARKAANAADLSVSTGFFGGMNAVGFNDCYGVDTTLDKYAKCRSYTEYSTPDDFSNGLSDELILKIGIMHRELDWHGPIDAVEFAGGNYSKQTIQTTGRVLALAEQKARANNDNLDSDLGKFQGRVNTHGIPWIRSEALEEVCGANMPIVDVNYDAFRTIWMPGINMEEKPAERQWDLHLTIGVDFYSMYQNVNINRRQCGRIDKVAAA